MKLLPSTRRGRIVLAAAIALIAIAALVVWLRRPQPPAVATSPVGRGDIEQTVEATGTIKPWQLVSVGAQVSGRIESLKVKLGDTVKSGDLIAEIDSRTQLNTLKSTQAALRNAIASRDAETATLHQYELAFKRQQQMLDAEATSQADFESAKADLDSARAQVAALDATIAEDQTAVDTAQTNLGYTKITAPIDGTVLAVVSKQGQTVNASQSAPTIVMLGSLDKMTVYSEISEADVVKAKEGQEVYFTILGNPDKRYRSTLRDIAPAPESITDEDSSSSSSTSSSTSSTSSSSSSAIYYYGLFDIDNSSRELRTYMTAQVSIVLGRASNVLTIPSAALGDKAADGSYTVRVAGKDGPPRPRKVVIGLNNNSIAEVKSGLKEGEQVVVGEASASTTTNNTQSRRGFGGPGGPPPM
ncbi:MAG: efflux RND transporter periplasmic adaptor subunit [Pseudoxanthomonas sp.]